jgi:dephospho-CoA kinase
MRTIGLTGGIGSGKSTVAKMLVNVGVALVDADAIARGLTVAGGAAMPEISRLFGASVVAADGSLNREAMRKAMLQDASAKKRLEGILHPWVAQGIEGQLARARDGGAAVAVVDMALLVEGGLRWRSRLDAVWVVDCLPQTQVSRVQARSGWPVAQIQGMMAMQASRAQRLSSADAVIHNEALRLDALRDQVQTLHSWMICSPARTTSGAMIVA